MKKPKTFDEAVAAAYQELPEYLDTVLHAAFYGSRVRGHPGPNADWDLVVFTPVQDPEVERRVVIKELGLDVLLINWSRTRRLPWGRRELAASLNAGRWVAGVPQTFEIDWEGLTQDKYKRTRELLAMVETHKVLLKSEYTREHLLRLRRFMMRSHRLNTQHNIPCTPEIDEEWRVLTTEEKMWVLDEFNPSKLVRTMLLALET